MFNVFHELRQQDEMLVSSENNGSCFNDTNTASFSSANYSTSSSSGLPLETMLRGPLLFLGALGCLTNAAVLFVLISSGKSHGTSNFFIMNQTFIDMFACFLMSASTIVALAGVTKFSLIQCIFIGSGITTMSAINASTMSMVIIALESR